MHLTSRLLLQFKHLTIPDQTLAEMVILAFIVLAVALR